MTIFECGKSAWGQPQIAFEFKNDGPFVVVIGGVHGDEYEGVAAAEGLISELLKHNPFKLNLLIIPRFNPDGVLRGTRTNGAGVDLNRNLPTKDWSPVALKPRYQPGPAPGSESENKFLIDLLQTRKPKLIISLHSWEPMLNVNGDCIAEAQAIANITKYRIDPDIGYPTPGSLGTYAAVENNCPTLTYEIQRDLDVPSVLKIHVPAVFEGLKVAQKR